MVDPAYILYSSIFGQQCTLHHHATIDMGHERATSLAAMKCLGASDNVGGSSISCAIRAL